MRRTARRLIHARGRRPRGVPCRPADTARAQLYEVLHGRVLEAVMREAPLPDLMDLLCREVERLAPEVVASVLAVDDEARLRPLAAPSMPPHVAAAIDGLAIGPEVGSCGSAAWHRVPVLAVDMDSDPRWAPYKALVLPLGLHGCWSTPILDGSGRVLGTFAFYYRGLGAPTPLHQHIVGISAHLCALLLQRERTRAQMHRLENYDPLTGAPNRALLRAEGARALHDARQAGRPAALLKIGIDRFKHVNDSHGLATGDALLRSLARRLQQLARGSDLIGRLAGDEFAMLLPHCGAHPAAAAAERVLEALAQPHDAGGVALHLRASAGIAMFPDDGDDLDTLLHHAGLALAQAKSAGPGGYAFFGAELNRAAQERAMLEADLRGALAGGGLELHFQPQLRAGGALELHGAEALLRWTHPRLGPVPPQRFVALAEDCGLIGELGRWVLARACAQLAAWRRRGIAVPRVSVNLSPSNFRDPGLPHWLAAQLAVHGLPSAELTLEMTEGVMLDADPAVQQTVRAVHALGVVLSIDDFGSGYSSLGYLHRLPIAELKLDRSFVQDLETSDSARALTHAVLRIAESLGMQVVAEGVETERQRELLAERGCVVMQGWLYARAMAPAAFERWLEERALREPV